MNLETVNNEEEHIIRLKMIAVSSDLMFERTVGVTYAVSGLHITSDLMFDRTVGVSEPSNSFIGF